MIKNINARTTNTYLLVVGITLLILYILISFLTIPFADDFFRFNYTHQKGPLGLAIYRFIHWDGREISLVAIFRNYLYYLFYSMPRVPNVINALFFLFNGFFLGQYFIEKFNIKFNSKYEKFLFFIVISLIIWFTIYPWVGEVIYWSSFYWSLILSTYIFIYAYEIIFKKDSFNKKDKIILIISSFFFGNSGSLTYIGIFVGFFIFIFIEQFIINKRKKIKELFIYIILPFLIGIIPTLISPVYFNKTGYTAKVNAFNLQTLLEGFASITDKLQYIKLYPLYSSILLFILIKSFSKISYSTNNSLYLSIKYFFIGILGIYIFTPIYSVISARHTFLVSIFLLLSLFYLFELLFSKLIKYTNSTIVLLTIAVFFIFFLSKDFTKLYLFNKYEYKPRIDQINSQRYHDAKVCKIAWQLYPYSTRDVYPKNNWVNREMATYYKTKSLTLNKGCNYKNLYKGLWSYKYFFLTKTKCNFIYKQNIKHNKNE